jgi:Zn-dependent oligopeptidase
MTHTLLSFTGLPPFNQIQANDIEAALTQLHE